MIAEADIDPAAGVPRMADVATATSVPPELLASTVVLKLNGGLGTSMGLDYAKSLLLVKGAQIRFGTAKALQVGGRAANARRAQAPTRSSTSRPSRSWRCASRPRAPALRAPAAPAAPVWTARRPRSTRAHFLGASS
jgi:hypothetical protein